MNTTIENVLEILKIEIKSNFKIILEINSQNNKLSVKLFNENTKKEYLFNILITINENCIEYDIDTTDDFNKNNFLRNKSLVVDDMHSVIDYLDKCINSTNVAEVLSILEDAFLDDKFEDIDIDSVFNDDSFTVKFSLFSKPNLIVTYVEGDEENSTTLKINHFDEESIQTFSYFDISPETIVKKCMEALNTYKMCA